MTGLRIRKTGAWEIWDNDGRSIILTPEEIIKLIRTVLHLINKIGDLSKELEYIFEEGRNE